MNLAPTPSIPHKPTIRRSVSSGVYEVESRRRPGTVHMVNVRYLHCTCEAGKQGVRCWHLSFCMGLDAWRTVQATKAAAPAGTATRRVCVG